MESHQSSKQAAIQIQVSNACPIKEAPMAPTEYPQKIKEMIAARYFNGAYSEISEAIFGITPPNPNPAITRQIVNMIAFGAKPESMVKILKQ